MGDNENENKWNGSRNEAGDLEDDSLQTSDSERLVRIQPPFQCLTRISETCQSMRYYVGDI